MSYICLIILILVHYQKAKQDEERKVERNVNEDGSVEESYLFNSELQLKRKDYIWQNKYKPRKPRFFNRVHTVRHLSAHMITHA